MLYDKADLPEFNSFGNITHIYKNNTNTIQELPLTIVHTKTQNTLPHLQKKFKLIKVKNGWIDDEFNE